MTFVTVRTSQPNCRCLLVVPPLVTPTLETDVTFYHRHSRVLQKFLVFASTIVILRRAHSYYRISSRLVWHVIDLTSNGHRVWRGMESDAWQSIQREHTSAFVRRASRQTYTSMHILLWSFTRYSLSLIPQMCMCLKFLIISIPATLFAQYCC